ncbi:hypothetical protein CN918_28500 [Priestia megaterium]|nr:hypothetical protein CN918_28500 [Priestia megaterium]
MAASSRSTSVIIVTLLSMICCCASVIFGSLTPIAETGPHANKFGSPGMWSAIISLVLLYVISLMMYVRGIKFIKYIMAVFCAIGLMMSIAFAFDAIVTILIKGPSGADYVPFAIGLAVSGVLGTVVNIIWFPLVFKKTKKAHIQVI